MNIPNLKINKNNKILSPIIILVLFCIFLFIPSITFAKDGRTYYTEEKLVILKENIKTYEWAREMRDKIINEADYWAQFSDEKLRTLVPSPSMPRAITISDFGCPIHGLGADKEGSYKWLIDFNNPGKIKCPVGGEEYPSNNFSEFLKSGKDNSLLTGNYPDNGWGWTNPETGKKYWFVGYYNHWSARKFLLPAIWNLSQAALITENSEYAHKASLLLWQLSQYYPDYQYEKQSREGEEVDKEFLGKLFYHTWEVASISPDEKFPPPAETYALAYDAIYPFIQNDKELEKLTGQSPTNIDNQIREKLLLEIARSITDGSHRIYGNYGSHQKALVRLAVVLDEKEKHPTSQEMIDWVLKRENVRFFLDMGVEDALINIVSRDGVPFESPIYNYSEWTASLVEIAESLLDSGINLFKDPRFQKLLTWHFNVCLAEKFMPSMGDSGDMFAANTFWNSQPEVLATILRHFPDPRLAQALGSVKNIPRDLFETPIEEILKSIKEKPSQSLCTQSVNLPGYGLATLQTNDKKNPTASSIFYGAYYGHHHYDKLNMVLFSQGNSLLTDFGYPETLDASDPLWPGFFANSVAHNTVVVDASKQEYNTNCKLHSFNSNGSVKIADISCEDAYPEKVSLYRRVNMLVEANPTQSYLLDIFYVKGGEQHDYIIHGTQANFSCETPLGPVQKEGTLAGTDIPYGKFYDDLELKDKPWREANYTSYKGSGYQFLFNVQKTKPKDNTVCSWQLIGSDKNIGLRAHFLTNNNEELIACDGKPQARENLPETVKFLIRREQGKNLNSVFVSLFEPYNKKTWIKNISTVAISPDDNEAIAVKVELNIGETHYLFHSLNPDKEYTVDGKIKVKGQTASLILNSKGQIQKASLLNGEIISLGNFSLKGTGIQKTKISSVDYKKGIIELADPILNQSLQKGQVLILESNGRGDSLTIEKVIDSTHLSISNEDLRVARGLVEEVIPSDNKIISQMPYFFAQPGVTVINSRFEAQGWLKTIDQSGFTLERADSKKLKLSDFPADEKGYQSYTMVVAGPGNQILIPDLVKFEIEKEPWFLKKDFLCLQLILIILAILGGIILSNFTADLFYKPAEMLMNLVLGFGFKGDVETDDRGIPIAIIRRSGGKYYNPVTVTMAGFDYYDKWQKNKEKKYFQYFKNCADWLADNLKIRDFKGFVFGVWEYYYPWTYNLTPPWISALAQGVGVQFLSRIYKITGEEKYLEAAKLALNALSVDVKDGGVTYKDEDGGWWYEEYVGEGAKKSLVLNGMIYALIGVNEYYKNTGDIKAKELLDKGVISLKKHVWDFDAGWWTYYDKLGVMATKSYHLLHSDLMKELYDITGEKIFLEACEKWAKYKSKFFIREFIKNKPHWHDMVVLCLNIGIVFIFLELLAFLIKI